MQQEAGPLQVLLSALEILPQRRHGRLGAHHLQATPAHLGHGLSYRLVARPAHLGEQLGRINTKNLAYSDILGEPQRPLRGFNLRCRGLNPGVMTSKRHLDGDVFLGQSSLLAEVSQAPSKVRVHSPTCIAGLRQLT